MPTSLGPAEILVILIVALIVLGPKKLPEAGRQVGRAIAEVRKWSQGFQDEIRTAIDPVAPSYQPPPGTDLAAPQPAPPVPDPPPGPATPADAEYTGPMPETVAPVEVDVYPAGPAVTADPDADVPAPPASTNGSASGPAAIEPSEPPAGDPPRS